MFSRGDQVIYIPAHLNGDHNHQDAEHGFVTGVGPTLVFCRFFVDHTSLQLRTTSNSEGCRPADLIKEPTRNQTDIDDLLFTM